MRLARRVIRVSPCLQVGRLSLTPPLLARACSIVSSPTPSINLPEGVVVGVVEDVRAHPNASKLQLCTVRTGEKDDDTALRSIVCGGKAVENDRIV